MEGVMATIEQVTSHISHLEVRFNDLEGAQVCVQVFQLENLSINVDLHQEMSVGG